MDDLGTIPNRCREEPPVQWVLGAVPGNKVADA